MSTFQKKKDELTRLFSKCRTREEIYQTIMHYSRTLPAFDAQWRSDVSLVVGCQSVMHLHSELKEGALYFFADSDALISKGLAALLVFLYSGESPETVIKASPAFLEEVGVIQTLSPGRANGFSALLTKMRQFALATLVKAQ